MGDFFNRSLLSADEYFAVENAHFIRSLYEDIYNVTRRTPKWNELAPNFVMAIDVFTFIVGVLGNLAVCFVILLDKSLHTTTNFYLFNLSISDIVLLVTSAPFIIYSNLHPDKVYYAGAATRFFEHWILETAVNVSVLTITAFTVERYLAICHPFLSQSMSQLPRVKKILISTWFIAITFAFLLAADPKLIIECCNEGLEFLRGLSTPYLTEILLAIFFVIPFLILSIMYGFIGIKLMKSSKGRRIGSQSDEANRKTLKMLVLIVAVFFFCWAPFHVQRVMLFYIGKVDYRSYETYFIIYNYVSLIKSVTYTVSPAVNPIIYTMMSKKFRIAFRHILSKFCGIPHQRSHSSHSNTQEITL